MTKREAAIITAYTGNLIGKFVDFSRYAEELAGEPISTHMFADKEVMEKLKELAKPDFLRIHENLTD